MGFGNGLIFHPEVAAAAGKPPPHLTLVIRRHHLYRWCIRGEQENEIGRHQPSARAALAAIRLYCRRDTCTATVRVYNEDGYLHATKEIGFRDPGPQVVPISDI